MCRTRFSAGSIVLSLLFAGVVVGGQAQQQSGSSGTASASSGSSGSQSGGSATGGSSGSSSSLTTGSQASDPNFQGSVPQGRATDTPIALSLVQAINRGLRTNLGLLTNQQSSREAQAQRLRALSTLLPKVTGEISAVEQQLNLQAEGFSFTFPPGAGIQIPTIIGPYGYQSAQANVSLTLFDWSAISNYRASRASERASVLDVKNARDLVVLGVGYAYLQIIADAARISATQAELDADTAVYTNAVRRHDAGTAIGIDVLRSQVQVKQRQQTLIAVKNTFEIDKISLGRVIGLPPGQEFSVTDPALSLPPNVITLKEALSKAYDNRSDFQAAKARVTAAEFSLRGARAERYPSATASGFYGDTGIHLFTQSHGVFNATGSLTFNIFDGGRIRADILQYDAELRNQRNSMENLRGQIDAEVRTALLNLTSAAAQVEVALSNVELSNQTLRQSRDRFAAGVTNTVEVVQAQQSVADANESLISAQYQNNIAKISLVRALGLAEQGMTTFFQPKQP